MTVPSENAHAGPWQKSGAGVRRRNQVTQNVYITVKPASSTALLNWDNETFDSSYSIRADPMRTSLISTPGSFASSFLTDMTQ